jgi:hypothetical protein
MGIKHGARLASKNDGLREDLELNKLLNKHHQK